MLHIEFMKFCQNHWSLVYTVGAGCTLRGLGVHCGGWVYTAGAGCTLRGLGVHIVEARAPVKNNVKNKVKNKKPITLSIVNNKPFYIFPPKDLLCIVCAINVLF
jgi:hypothetical protein